MSDLEKITIHRIVKDKEKIHAFYTSLTKTYGYYGRNYETDYIGSFSKAEWRMIALKRAVYLVAKNLFWIAGLIGLGLFVASLTVFWNSFLFGASTFLMAVAFVILGMADLMERSFDAFLGEKILKKFKLMPKSPVSEVRVDLFVDGKQTALINHLKNVSKSEFVNIAESFAKWKKTKSAYKKLEEQTGYRHNYEDEDLLDFVNAKKKALREKVMKNEVEAYELSKAIKKGIHHEKLIEALQETEEILAS